MFAILPAGLFAEKIANTVKAAIIKVFILMGYIKVCTLISMEY